jgi:ribonuclease VapC
VSRCVLDASALLALVYLEPGHETVAELVNEPGAVMSAVNLSEAVARLSDQGWTAERIRLRVSLVSFTSETFDEELGYQAGLLRPLTRHAGLSFGDRACLALAQRLGLPAVTADRSWTTLRLPITVQVIR